jgi:hypothetical protein
VFRGPNPEARVYAVAALRQLKAVSASDRAVIDRLTALPLKVTNCVGCLFSKGTVAEALRTLR